MLTVRVWAVSWYFSSTVELESDDTCIVQIPEKRYYRFWYYHGFTEFRNFFEAKRLVIAILLKTKPGICKPNQWKRSKHSNRTVNSQAFVKTAINSNITVFLYTIYQAQPY